MYAKLFYGNIRKALQDYALYFLTLVISSTLFFAFLSLYSRHNRLLSGMDDDPLSFLQTTVRYLVLAISVIFVALIRYINTFMLRQRSREFSIYLILGMEQGMVARQFLGETLVFGIAAVAAGCVSGTVLSGVLTVFVVSNIDMPGIIMPTPDVGSVTEAAQFHLGFYPDTILQTCLFFLLSFLLVGAWNARRIYRMKLIGLLQEKKQGEGQTRKRRHYIFYFVVTILCFVITVATLCNFVQMNGIYAGDVPAELSNRYQTAAVVAAIVGIFSLYHAFVFILTVIRRGNRWKNQGINSVLLGSLYQKVSQTAKVLSISTLAITVSLVAFVILPMMAEITLGYLKYRMPYDVMINNNYIYIDRLEDIPEIDYSFIRDILAGQGIVIAEEVSQESYFVWEGDFNTVDTRENWRDVPRLAMRISDYNDMRKMAGLAPVSLSDGEFFMHLDYEMDVEEVEAAIGTGGARRITLDDGTTLTLAETHIYRDQMGTYLFNGVDSVLVFPDAVCDGLFLARTCYYANTKTAIPYSLCDTIGYEIEASFRDRYGYLFEQYEEKYQSDRHYASFISPIRFRTQEYSDTVLTATGLRLLGIYAGVIFFIICMTVLALHVVTDSIDQRMQYETLFQMGVEKDEIVKMAGRQSRIYFFVPCLAAFVIALSLIGSFFLRYGYKVFTYISSAGFRFGVLIPSVLIILILMCYYGVAIYTIKRGIR